MSLFKQLKTMPRVIPVALVGIIAALIFTANSNKPLPPPQVVREPAPKPYEQTIAGMGIVEGYGENINVAPFRSGKVTKVYVTQGQQVKKGQPLYAMDDAELQMQLKSALAEAQARQQSLALLQHSPRPEDLPPAEALVAQSKAQVADLALQVSRYDRIQDKRAINPDELSQKQFKLEAAQAQLKKAEADLNRLKAGAWRYEIQRAKADLTAAQARVKQTQVLLGQSVIQSPREGEVLQVTAREGEFIFLGPNSTPTGVMVGDTKKLQVRVDIDEINASEIRPGMKARASLKGDPSKKLDLSFVRIEPYMVAKKNLSGASMERVDVRVLQLIYAFTPPEYPVFTGQQVDVFLERPKGGQ